MLYETFGALLSTLKKLAFLTELCVFVEVKVIQVTHAEVVVAM